jgi:hypothetical protein
MIGPPVGVGFVAEAMISQHQASERTWSACPELEQKQLVVRTARGISTHIGLWRRSRGHDGSYGPVEHDPELRREA